MDINQLIAIICQECDIDLDSFINGKLTDPKHRHFTARRLFCYMARKFFEGDYTYSHLAEMYGKRLASGKGDYVSAMYYENCCRDMISIKNKEICDKLAKINAKILKK